MRPTFSFSLCAPGLGTKPTSPFLSSAETRLSNYSGRRVGSSTVESHLAPWTHVCNITAVVEELRACVRSVPFVPSESLFSGFCSRPRTSFPSNTKSTCRKPRRAVLRTG